MPAGVCGGYSRSVIPHSSDDSVALQPRAQRRDRWAVLLVVCASALIVNIDNTILNVALPTLVRKLHATSSELQWIVDSYAMVFAGLLLVGGSLADRFGRKRFFLIGLSVFAGGSIGAAFSGSVDPLIVWRAVMGAGAALTIPSSLSIINDVFRDTTERARAIGAWAATIGLGIAIGPIAGGLLLTSFWWGSIFLVNVPIVIAAFVGAMLVRCFRSPVWACCFGRLSRDQPRAGARRAWSESQAPAFLCWLPSSPGRLTAATRC
jgi:MFS family permease